MKRLIILTALALLATAPAADASSPPRIGVTGDRIYLGCSNKPNPDPNTNIRIAIRSGGVKRIIYAELETCSKALFNPTPVWGPGWAAGRWTSTSIYMRTTRRNRPTRFSINATHRGKPLLRYSFSQRHVFNPARRIWSGTDAFWNYCINQYRPTYSRNGRLYCVKPARSFDRNYRFRFRVGGWFWH